MNQIISIIERKQDCDLRCYLNMTNFCFHATEQHKLIRKFVYYSFLSSTIVIEAIKYLYGAATMDNKARRNMTVQYLILQLHNEETALSSRVIASDLKIITIVVYTIRLSDWKQQLTEWHIITSGRYYHINNVEVCLRDPIFNFTSTISGLSGLKSSSIIKCLD